MGAAQQALIGASAPAGATDPSFASVVLLCHMEDTTTPTDSTGRHTGSITKTGSAAFSSTQKKWGAKSLSLPTGASADGISVSDSADWTFTGQFTIEAWVYYTSAPGGGIAAVCHQWGNGNAGNLGWWFGNLSGFLQFLYSTTGSNNPTVSGNWTPALNTWHHVAVDRDASNVIRVYQNGTVLGSATVSGALFNSSHPCVIGGGGQSYASIVGFIDDLRITNGVARYGGAFSPPSAVFPDS